MSPHAFPSRRPSSVAAAASATSSQAHLGYEHAPQWGHPGSVQGAESRLTFPGIQVSVVNS